MAGLFAIRNRTNGAGSLGPMAKVMVTSWIGSQQKRDNLIILHLGVDRVFRIVFNGMVKGHKPASKDE